MNYRRVIFLCMFVSPLFSLTGCQPPSRYQGGFAVSTAEKTQSASGALSPPRFIPNVPVSGYFTGTISGEQVYGTAQSYSGVEGVNGPGGYPTWCGAPEEYNSNNYYWVCYGESPADWKVSFTLNYWCGDTNLVYSTYGSYQYQYDAEVFLTKGVEGDCVTTYIPPASTRFAILGQLPQTLTLTGEAPYTTTYGMPQLYVYDGTATLVATETAKSVSSDGSQATFPFPSTLQQSGYSVAVANQTNSTAGISAVGTNYLSIAISSTVPGNPFGVSVGAQTYNSTSCTLCSLRGQNKCTTSSGYGTFPVVSLYSKNQVLIGGATVSVGINPTAVATYKAASVFEDLGDDDCNTNIRRISGTTRAVVANSGSNSIGVLDIVNNALLFNVTVGNQPVALAVSSDGSTAYVANYKDSTVTQVNLTSGSATGTIAVGGKPTSVALTSAGILWVGGVGFLTEINTQTLGVVATEAVAGKTIVALGFSNSINELVATSVDTGGSVYADEINPSTVKAGAAYAPVATHMVSSLGTHLNQVTGTQVRAFTATLTGASTISTNQVGAPPLVVQDGWAVVTATPTGFTITDISGHTVLVSEKTPSPVTAIAVDYSLNVAYLVMPDSNILLTVPLPGTN